MLTKLLPPALNGPYRTLYIVLLALLTGLSSWAAYSWWQGNDSLLQWNTVGTAEQLLVPHASFRMGLYEFQTEATNYLLSQSYIGEAPALSFTPWLLLLAMLGLSLVLVLSICSGLSRWWYLISMGMIVFGSTFMQLEELQLFGKPDNTAWLILLVLTVPLSYYLHAFRPATSLIARLLLFSLALGAFGLILYLYSEISMPLETLAVNSFYIPLLVSLALILLVSHELPAVFLRITSSNSLTGSGNSLPHFAVIMVIYLGNLALLFLHNTRRLDLDIYYLNEFLVLPITLVLGIWGTQQREHLYANIISFTQGGGLLYLIGAVLLASTLGLCFYMGNDLAIEVFEDAIVFSHLGFGFIFLIYVISNFSGAMTKGMAVHKALYTPGFMPFATMRIVGAIATLGLFVFAGSVGLNQARAAYSIGLGDLYQAKDNSFLAEQYYRKANYYGFHNHRANYSMGAMARSQGVADRQVIHFGDAVKKHPSPYAYVNLARAYSNQGNDFDALLTLRKGIIDFPQSQQLRNNLGNHFARAGKPDSAYFHLQRSLQQRPNSVVEANLLALLGQERIAINTDSLARTLGHTSQSIVGANLYANANLSQQQLDLPIATRALSLPYLDIRERSYLHNGVLNQLGTQDSLLYQLLYQLDTAAVNASSQNSLEENLAYLAIARGRYREANDWLRRLRQYNEYYSGMFSEQIGLYAYAWGAPRQALEDLNRAVNSGRGEALLPMLLVMAQTEGAEAALTELQNRRSAGLSSRRDTTALRQLEAQLRMPATAMATADDASRYQWLFLHGTALPIADLLAQLRGISNPEYQAISTAEHLLYQLDRAEEAAAGQLYALLSNIPNTGERSSLLKKQATLAWFCTQDRWESAFGLIAVDEQDPTLQPYQLLLQAVEAEIAQELDLAATTYLRLARANPYFEQGVLEGARFMQEQARDAATCYDLLIRALQYNPHSIRLLKAHVLQAMRMNLPEYAESSLARLDLLLPAEAAREFRALARQVYEEAQAELDWSSDLSG